MMVQNSGLKSSILAAKCAYCMQMHHLASWNLNRLHNAHNKCLALVNGACPRMIYASIMVQNVSNSFHYMYCCVCSTYFIQVVDAWHEVY